jgi:hypothetical protein
MSLLKAFSPPAFLPDFHGIPGQAEAWHNAVNAWFESSIASQKSSVKSQHGNSPGVVQFYNPAKFDPGSPLAEQAITWNAFPKELIKQCGYDRAFIAGDRLETLNHYSKTLNKPVHFRTFYRPLNEYCEWHTVRDPDTQKITKITLSSEPPEYWRALFGDEITIDKKIAVKFPGDRHRVLELYRELVSPEVQMDDLICKETIPNVAGLPPLAVKGGYNTYNKWNTTHGIAHLCSPPNSLAAEIGLGAAATVLRVSASGKPIVQPEQLTCCSLAGGPDRNSDPTIGSSLNALARAGAFITLQNPVGLYMDHIDTSGWSGPKKSDISDCVRIVRGTPGMIERLTIEVPSERGFQVGDITIGGAPIVYGGQIAACITVKLIGGAAGLGTVHNKPVKCTGRCCIDLANPVRLNRPIPFGSPTPVGMVDAFFRENSAGTVDRPKKQSKSRRSFRHLR